MSEGRFLWEQLADELEASDPAVNRSTMMGSPCLRRHGVLFASLETGTGDLIVKLPAGDVSARSAAGYGRPFAPTGKPFREWVVITEVEEDIWRTALDDAVAFARTK